MQTEEKIQVVDQTTGEPTGEIVTRGELFEKKLWCRTTNVFVMNAEGQLLCHKRGMTRERFPGAWSTHFGGHVSAGESFRINALKEAEEELGLKVNVFQMIPWRTSCKTSQRIWARDFITVYNGRIEDLVYQKSEIDEIAWFSPNEILTNLTNESQSDWKDDFVGFHDFNPDYLCMRAVLTACLDLGVFSTTYHPLHKWNPSEF
jgi:isopentenyldiphosphate isomerase